MSTHQPAQHARRIFEQESAGSGMDWGYFCWMYERWPRVLIDTPELFCAARPVKWAERDLIASEKAWSPEDADTWFVWVLVGSLAGALERVPFESRAG